MFAFGGTARRNYDTRLATLKYVPVLVPQDGEGAFDTSSSRLSPLGRRETDDQGLISLV